MLLTSSGCQWGWFPGKKLWSGPQWRLVGGWSSESCWWLSAPPGPPSETPSPQSPGTTHCRLQEHTEWNYTQTTAAKCKSLLGKCISDRVLQCIITGQEKMCGCTHLQKWANTVCKGLCQCLCAVPSPLSHNVYSGPCDARQLPAPCFSSSAAELVTDGDVLSTTSSRGSTNTQRREDVSEIF